MPGDCVGYAAAWQSSIHDNMERVENEKMGDYWFWILDDIIAIRWFIHVPLRKYDKLVVSADKLERKIIGNSGNLGHDGFIPSDNFPKCIN